MTSAKSVWPVRVSVELGGRIDAAAAAAGLKRSVWMVRALESALADDTQTGSGDVPARPAAASPRGASRPSASSRASGPVRLDTVPQAQQWALDRQAKLNAAKERS